MPRQKQEQRHETTAVALRGAQIGHIARQSHERGHNSARRSKQLSHKHAVLRGEQAALASRDGYSVNSVGAPTHAIRALGLLLTCGDASGSCSNTGQT